MQLKIIKELDNNFYSVRVENILTETETELVSDFGDPTISLGGDFYGYTISGVSLPNRTYVVGDTSASKGYIVDTNVLHQLVSTPSFTTEGLNHSLATISALTNVNYTLSINSKFLEASFPQTAVFTTSINANIYASEIEHRMTNVLNTLKSNVDNFSDEVIVTL